MCLAACGGEGATPASPAPSDAFASGRADVGGYELAYRCQGTGSPTVVLEAGLGASGVAELGDLLDPLSTTTRVCTYDRAGTGVSDRRPDGTGPVTAGLIADELHELLEVIGVRPPIVIAAHSFGGMPARAFEGAYPDGVAGLVLIEVSSEPEVPIYERLDAGPWIDGSDRIDIGATVEELHAAGDLDDLPVVVVTAERITDRWLKTVPDAAARAQARLAGLSGDGMEVVAEGSGHFVYRTNPELVIEAIRIAVEAARSGSALPACEEAFQELHATCVPRGDVPDLIPA